MFREFQNAISLIERKDYDAARRALSEFSFVSLPPAADRLYRYLLKKAGGCESLVRTDLISQSREDHATDLPRISVVTPSFNQGQFIRETIESVLTQSYKNFEYIIIDGGSTDETVQIVSEYRDRISYFVSEKDRGQSDAINKGFAHATGEILCWLNSDDQFHTDALESVANAFRYDVADMVVGAVDVLKDGVMVHRHLPSCRDGELPLERLLNLDTYWNGGHFFFQPEVFFSSKLWRAAGSHVRLDCFYSMDYELWCRFARCRARVKTIGRSLTKFRVHEGQKTSSTQKFKDELIIVRQKFLERYGGALAEARDYTYNFGKKLNVIFINDHGIKFGAGIAHGRIGEAFLRGGARVDFIDVASIPGDCLSSRYKTIMRQLNEVAPDVVVFGNLHSVDSESIELLDMVSKRYVTYWVLHDFWLLTGRCAYTEGCKRYLSLCTSECPTSRAYPSLVPEKIQHAFQEKLRLLSSHRPPRLLANSRWTYELARNFLRSQRLTERVKLNQIRLGLPKQFRPILKVDAREFFGLSPQDFVICFSASSLSDERKGGHILLEALREIDDRRVVLLAIGAIDRNIEIGACRFFSLGYVSDAETIVYALSAANVYVGPSSEETFGQVFIEAAACGTASIGFLGSGTQDAILHDVSGWLIGRGSKELAEKISHLISNPEHCFLIGKTARIFAENEYSMEASFKSFFNVFDEHGLLEDLGIAPQISLVPNFELDKDFGAPKFWRIRGGVSNQEGPYAPDFPFVFQWCHGRETVVKINRSALNNGFVFMSYCNPLFDLLQIGVTVDGVVRSNLFLDEFKSIVKIDIGMGEGWAELKLSPERVMPSTDSELRELTFMLIDFSIEETLGGSSGN